MSDWIDIVNELKKKNEILHRQLAEREARIKIIEAELNVIKKEKREWYNLP